MENENLKVGFARVCITPPLGINISGYFYPRIAKGVLDDLYANAVSFVNSQKTVVLISVDLLYITDDFANSYRRKISEKLNISIDAVFLSATHTHTGPTLGIRETGDGMPIYDEYLGELLCNCAQMALDDAKAAKLSYSSGTVENIAFVRAYHMKDGSVKTNPGIGNPDIVRPVSEPHKGMYLLKAERDNTDDIYIVNFGVHPDTISGDYISADWCGILRNTVENALGTVKCAFFTGFQGDLNHFDVSPIKGEWDIRHGYEFTKYMGMALAGGVLQICGKTKPFESKDIDFATKKISIRTNKANDKLEDAKKVLELYRKYGESFERREDTPNISVPEALRIERLENGPESFEILLSAVKIGDVVFGGIPGEPFNDIGKRIRERSKHKMTLLCCCTNGGSTYFPTSDAYDQGIYEAVSSNVKKGEDFVIADEMVKLINSLENDSKVSKQKVSVKIKNQEE
ncbi:MAG: neutral/alkaline non-lysosomal ceramidase N-terminal domain-containing protein [Oscillospiraceae bacterium]|nr:neutral/alkaline non-lysosomal ceramidase N-terminal domain-containing protein [Oscillospiraceae bacterium]